MIVKANLKFKLKKDQIEVNVVPGGPVAAERYRGKLDFGSLDWDNAMIKKYDNIEVLYNCRTHEIENLKIVGDKIVVEKVSDHKVNANSATNKVTTDSCSSPVHISSIPANRQARAPYNFIPLSDCVIEADTKPDDLGNDLYHKGRFTGHIDVEIKTMTDIYIRDTTRNGDPNPNPDFFSPAGKYRIPGSSLRGMVRNLFEICTFSKFGYSMATDRHYKTLFFYRRFTDRDKKLERDYRYEMVDGDEKSGYFNPIKAGYIKRIGVQEYQITPAKVINRTTFFRCEQEQIVKAGLNEHMAIMVKDKYVENELYEKYVPQKVFFKADVIQPHKHSKLLRYAAVKSIRSFNGKPEDGEYEGYAMYSCWMRGPKARQNGRGKHMHWVIGPKSEGVALTVSKDLFRNTMEDYATYSIEPVNRLFERVNNREELPCFYVDDGKGQVTAFGFTGNFRIPFSRTVDKQLPKVHLSETIDMTEAVFGVESRWGTRVFFEDAFLKQSDRNCVSSQARVPFILASPKATCYQHYLTQKTPVFATNNFGEDIVELRNYNDETTLRGNKIYWHRQNCGWVQNNEHEIRRHPNQYTKIKTVGPGAHFCGRIRFENLSGIELGALLFVLKLKEAHCHKIGMGKPLGLGSIKITPRLVLSDRISRYKNLLEEWGTNGKPADTNQTDVFIKEFENFILQKTGCKNLKTLWDHPRMIELAAMLDFSNASSREWHDLTRYLEIERFGNNGKENEYAPRKVLPLPSKVKNRQ